VGDPVAVILVPVLRRPHRVAPLIESIDAATPEPHRTLFVLSPGDDAEFQAVRAAGGEWLVMDDCYEGAGDYARKINAGYRYSTEPLLFLGADDLKFHPGWLDRAVSRLGGTVHVVGTNDLGNPAVLAGEHSTHSLVTRDYVDVFGTVDEQAKVLHEGYRHNFCDTEFVSTAQRRNAFAFEGTSVVEHFHPSWGKAQMDEVYESGRRFFEADRRTYMARRRLWRRMCPT
jgi:glycosyltransferase involved in cell wall biosynthesis